MLKKKDANFIEILMPYVFYTFITLACMDFCANGSMTLTYLACPCILFFMWKVKKLRLDCNTVCLLIFSFAIFITSTIYFHPSETKRTWSFLLAFMLGYYGYLAVEDKKKYLHNVLFSIFLGFSLLLVCTYIYNLTISRYGRVLYYIWTGLPISVTHIGTLSSVVVAYSIYSFFLQKKLWLKLFTAFVMVVVVLINLDTGTRTPILTIPLVYAFMFLFFIKKIGKRKLLIIGGGLLGCGVLAAVVIGFDLFGIRDLIMKIPFFSRFAIEGMSTPRLQEYMRHLKLTFEYPWGGNKINTVAKCYAHNYLQDAHDRYGIIAFACMIVMTVFFVTNLLRLILREKKTGLDIVLIAFYISMPLQLCLEPIFNGYSNLMWAFLLVHGLTTANLSDRKKTELAPPADYFEPRKKNSKTVVEINVTDYGSTGKIMLQTASLARREGHVAYTFSKMWNEKHVTPNHNYIGSKKGNILHHIVGPLTGKSERLSRRSTRHLIEDLKEIKPDIIHLHNLHGWYLHLPSLFRYIKENDVRVIWTLHDCWAFTGQCPHFDMIGCEKWKTGCYKCPQLKSYPRSYVDGSKGAYACKKEWFTGIRNMTVVAPSQWLADLVKESFLKEYPVGVIHNGIDLAVFQPTEGEFRKKYGLEGKRLLLGVSFNWDERKGLDVFLELAKRLPDDYRIVLVGTDKNVDKVLPNNVISIHRTFDQKELAEIYTAADVFVNPTREEVLGLVNIEALACGTPVVTFQTGGSPEILDEACGEVVAKNDVDALRSAIERICAEKPYSTGACTSRAAIFNKDEKFREYVKLYEKD